MPTIQIWKLKIVKMCNFEQGKENNKCQKNKSNLIIYLQKFVSNLIFQR